MIIIAGPCQIESDLDKMSELAERLYKKAVDCGFQFFFKASFDKANRSHDLSQRGLGLDEGLNTLQRVKSRIGCATITDIHERWQAGPALEVCKAIQIPAFLCRQTDLLKDARHECDVREYFLKSNHYLNVKKGQFLAPWDVEGILSKTGTRNVWITERGISFGYNRLIVDFTGIQYMAEKFDVPIIFDATHSVQMPGGAGRPDVHGEGKILQSGGNRQYVESLCKAVIGHGHVSGLFMEVHPEPDTAPSDGANMITPDTYERILDFAFRVQTMEKSIPKVLKEQKAY